MESTATIQRPGIRARRSLSGTESEENKRTRPHALRQVLHGVEHGLAVVGLLFIAYHIAFNLSVVISGSMSPTLQGSGPHAGDWVLTEKLSYRFRRPRRWEVIAFHNDEGMQIIKRIVGLPGEEVGIRDGWVLINDSPLPRPPSLRSQEYYAYGHLRAGGTLRTGNGYFVLGDNSEHSLDSRDEGPVGRDDIIGRAWFILWPPTRFGFVDESDTPSAAGH